MSDDSPKPVNLNDIAREAGVSVSTVSRALADSTVVSEETRTLIKSLAEKHSYTAPTRRSRSEQQAAHITLVMPAPHSGASLMVEPFALNLLGGVVAATRERQCNFTVAHSLPHDDSSLDAFMAANPHSSLIFLGQSQYHQALNKHALLGRPLVVWGAQMEDQSYCCIGSDNFHGGYRATSHLLRLGKKRIAFIGYSHILEIHQRFEGYQAALAHAGLKVDQSLVKPARLAFDAAQDVIDDLLDRGVAFDGIVGASDMLAVGTMRAMERRGLNIPRDISVVGYDDVDVASYSHPALTTIRQDVVKAGRLMVSKILRIRSGHQATSERLKTELIVRDSCGG